MAAAKPFASNTAGYNSPVANGFVVTPHDTNELAAVTRGVWVGGAGTVVVILDNDTVAVTLSGVPAGTLLPIRARIITTASTATLMIGLY